MLFIDIFQSVVIISIFYTIVLKHSLPVTKFISKCLFPSWCEIWNSVSCTGIKGFVNDHSLSLYVIVMTSTNSNFFRVTGPLWGEFIGHGEFPSQRPVTQSCDTFFDLHLNKRLSKPSDACGLRRNCAHFDITVMMWIPRFYIEEMNPSSFIKPRYSFMPIALLFICALRVWTNSLDF